MSDGEMATASASASASAFSAEVASGMAAAALELLALLDPQQLALAAYAFEDEERYRWEYTPGARGGLPLATLDQPQRRAAMALLASGLSEVGYRTACAVISLEPVLRELEQRNGRPGFERRDAGLYYVSVFGDPGEESPWGWRVGGHHLCLHVTLTRTGVSSTPMFFGANPAIVPDGARAGEQVLGHAEDAGRAFVLGLEESQRRLAVVSDEAPRDILTGNAVRAEIAAVPRGVGYDDLGPDQQSALVDLVAVHTGRAGVPMRLDPSRWTFAWAGPTRAGEGHYYAVRGDELLIEYDNTQNGANHIHSVVRDVRRDWGEDLLAAHYARARHGSAGNRGAPGPGYRETGRLWVT